VRAWVVSRCKDFFQLLRNESQKKRVRFVPTSIVDVAGPVSRVEMNAKSGALDTAPATTEVLLCKTLDTSRRCHTRAIATIRA